MKRIRLIGLLLLGYIFFTTSTLANGSNKDIWLLVNTQKLTLEIKKGDETIDIMKNIAIGRNGAGFKKRVGDDVTPLGDYQISWVNNKSSFHRFYGFNYPSVDNANQSLSAGLVSKRSHTAIINAHNKNEIPPQNTPMGGRIGIHGLGRADKKIHKTMNWTHGCIALTNEQINLLDPWITQGMRVKIK